MIDSVIPIPDLTTIELTLLAKFGADNDAGLQKLYIDYCRETDQEPTWEATLVEGRCCFIEFGNYIFQASVLEPEFFGLMFKDIANEKLRGSPHLN